MHFLQIIEKPNKEVRKAERIGLNVGECLASRWCRFWWWWDLRATPWDTLVGNSAGSVQGPAKHRSRSRLQSSFKSSFSCHLSIPLLENLSIILSKAQLLVAEALGSRGGQLNLNQGSDPGSVLLLTGSHFSTTMTYGEVLGRRSTSSQCYVNAMVGWVVSGQDERRLFYFSYSDVENTLLS